MVRIDMSNVDAREKAFGEYGDTVWLVYILFSERLKQHKREQNLTNVQIAGFKDTAEYDNTPDNQITIKANMVAAITAPVPRLDTKKNAYLVPSADYYLRFVDTLKFTDVYECIWGSNYEIREYLPKVFESLCKEAQLRNNRLGSLIHDINQTQPLKIPNSTIQQVYEEIKIDLLDEWDKFTRARKQETADGDQSKYELLLVNVII